MHAPISRPLSILYVGDLTPGNTCTQRRQALFDIGSSITSVDLTPPGPRKDRSAWERVRRRLLGPRDRTDANRQLLEAVRRNPFDLVWMDKGLVIEATTLKEIKQQQPRCLIVGYAPDDMYARHNQSRQFRRHLRCYDHFFTTKSYNVHELQSLGCPRVSFVGNAFDPHTHRPIQVTPDERQRYGGLVGFIGTWEQARATSLFRLAAAGVGVRVWGNSWEHCRRRLDHLQIERRALYGEEYAVAINAFAINLCFLRKQNRDLQTTRSVEIPACGAFMLAERTEEHRALFSEGVEAEFFGSDDELIDKVRYYLAHPEDRERIAAAALRRCTTSGYSYRHRMESMLFQAGARAAVIPSVVPMAAHGMAMELA